MSNTCGQIDALIPWYLNGTASEAVGNQVESHIEHCAACRLRLLREQDLIDRVRDAGEVPIPAADDAWRRFEATLGEAAPAPAIASGSVRWSAWLTRGVIIAQAAAVAALAVAVVVLLSEKRRGEPEFRTVTTVAATSVEQHLRIAAAAEVSTEQMAQIALEYGGTVIAGPSPQGVFTIRLDQAQMRDRAIQKLRATPGMLLVEPLDSR